MIRLTAVPAPLALAPGDFPALCAKRLQIDPSMILSVRVVKRSVDARRKEDVRFIYAFDVEVKGDERAIIERRGVTGASLLPMPETKPAAPRRTFPRRPIIIGSGPCGLFAALALAKAGARPLLIERGQPADVRKAQVEAFFGGGPLDPQSNIQFGEGGAGTFSDGKLNTGIKSHRLQEVLETFVQCGGPEDILWQAKPHMGTDHLVQVVQNMRRTIQDLGGEVRFGTCLTGLILSGGAVRGIRLGEEAIETEHVILAIGHSARDTFAMLHEAGVAMSAKPFSIGARIEHPQALVDRAQYGAFASHPALQAAEYKLSIHLPGGRGVYTFCMCPGGTVVGAASEAGGVVTNGMSAFARDGSQANSALLVSVTPADFLDDSPLAGIAFQRKWEQMAYRAGGGGYRAPAQRVEDFLMGRPSTAFGDVIPTYRPGTVPGDLRACLPPFATEAMAAAIPRLDLRLRGFALGDALLTGVETRSSSPVRIHRDEGGQASIRGLYPAGEGAGYAGGILSAAVDGLHIGACVLGGGQ